MSGENAYISYSISDDNGKTLYIKHKFIMDDGKIYTRSSYDEDWIDIVAANEECYGMILENVIKHMSGLLKNT